MVVDISRMARKTSCISSIQDISKYKPLTFWSNTHTLARRTINTYTQTWTYGKEINVYVKIYDNDNDQKSSSFSAQLGSMRKLWMKAT